MAQESYDSEKGLWLLPAPGHTQPVSELPAVHSGTVSASRLLGIAQDGGWADFPATDVLQALAQLQVREADSPLYGCFRWFAEETEPIDTNAAFFIGLNMLVLKKAYADELDAHQHALVDEMLEPLVPWFEGEAEEGKVHYPNKYLGDLVCLWLVFEATGRDTAPLVPVLERAGVYWRDEAWGWGEHLSDSYASVILDELTCLLLLADQLPAALRKLYTELHRGLMALEDGFVGGPRVPTVRSYALHGRLPRETFRQKVVNRELHYDTPQHRPKYLLSFGQVYLQNGWADLAGEPGPESQQLDVPCYGGAVGRMVNDGTLRFGALSRFPFMPNADQQMWGMSWQSMPLALAHTGGDWGFWRWGAEEGGRARFHPAEDHADGYLSNALSEQVAPCLVGQTHSVRSGSSFLALRRMPGISRAWPWCSDAFCLYDFSGEVSATETLPGGWHHLRLAWPEGRRLTLYFHGMGNVVAPVLTQEGQMLKWEVRWSKDTMADLSRLGSLWAISLEPGDVPPPVLEQETGFYLYPSFLPGEQVWRLEWSPFADTYRCALGEDNPLQALE